MLALTWAPVPSGIFKGFWLIVFILLLLRRARRAGHGTPCPYCPTIHLNSETTGVEPGW